MSLMRKTYHNKRAFNPVIRPLRRKHRRTFSPVRRLHFSWPSISFFGFSHRLYFVAFALAALFITLLFILFSSGQLRITTVQIEGASQAVQSQIQNFYDKTSQQKRFVFFKKDKAILFSAQDFTADLLSAVPQIRIAKVETHLPHTLSIDIEERVIEGIWCSMRSKECYFFDKESVLYDKAPNAPRGALIRIVRDNREQNFQLGDTAFSADMMDFIEKLNKGLELAYQKPVYISIEDDDEVHAAFNNASNVWEAYFSRSNSVISQIESLTLVLQEKIADKAPLLSYIDLRFGTKVFYKFNN